MTARPAARTARWPAAAAAARVVLAGSLAFVAACADIATAPIPVVLLQGSVRTPKGDPVAHAEIFFLAPSSTIMIAAPKAVEGRPPGTGAPRPAQLAANATLRVVTGSDGTFAASVPASTFDLYIYPAQGSGVPSARVRRFTIGRVKPRFDYRYSGFEVTGRVTGPQGDPVLYATLDFFNQDQYVSVSSRFNGTKYVAYLPPGRYSVDVEPPSPVSGVPGIYFPTIPIGADTTIDLTLTGSRVAGSVTDPDGTPLGGATIYFSGLNAGSGAVADGAGQYSLYVPDGSYMPYAFPPVTRHDIFSRKFPTVSVNGASTVDLAFRGITWSGVVRDVGSGLAIAGAEVDVLGLDYRYYAYLGRARSTTDASGVFRLFLETPEGYRLSVEAPGYAPLSGIEASAGADSTFDLYLTPAP